MMMGACIESKNQALSTFMSAGSIVPAGLDLIAAGKSDKAMFIRVERKQQR
jgi:hypothetical protein